MHVLSSFEKKELIRMQTIKYGNFAVLFVFLLVQLSFSATYTVSKDGTGMFSSIQQALDEAAKPGDVIEILDTATYAEQVTIDSTLSNLTLRSKNPRSLAKPTIKYTDKTNVGPTTAEEALDESKITFDRNGALQILGASNVLIQGIGVDGGGVTPFGSSSVWEGRYDMQHGNAAITLWVAGQCIIQDCDIRNAYFGINVKDRNIGGVFANPNPADINPEQIIPFSGFAKTGNHVVEYNRIHNNSVGMFFESTWDMGSTVRYNLFYENHHPTQAIAEKVHDLTPSEGSNQAGGAFMFKDILLSPLAIYNNTFWHNAMPFLGNWKAGGQHLIFNNIYAEPNNFGDHKYLNDNEDPRFNAAEMSKTFENRMHNCVYAAQIQQPTQHDVQISEGLRPVQTGGTYQPGALITPFPTSAEVRWLETKFLSIDPTSADFLTPDWSDAGVQEFIVDKGWAESGVEDPTGGPADLGAIPMGGGRPVDLVTMRLKMPIMKSSDGSGNYDVMFEVSERIGEIKNPKVTMFGIVTGLDTADVFGSSYVPIPSTNIRKIALGTQDVVVGENTFTVALPATGDFAFIEMFIEGTGQNGKPFTSAAGFFPYRLFKYIIKVEILDKVGGTVLTEVAAGQPVVLRATTYDGSQAVTPTIVEKNTKISLSDAGYTLFTPSGDSLNTLTGGFKSGVGTADVMFTKVPASGVEYVHVSAWLDQGEDNSVAFLGVSNGIRVKAGPPDSVVIEKPTQFGDVVEMQTVYSVWVQVFDKYGNRVDAPAVVNCVSLQPTIGDITTKQASTDSTGRATFPAYVADGGAPGDTFHIQASLEIKPTATATAFLIVGEPKDKLFILYGDTLAYDATAMINGCSGDKVPVTIRASADKDAKTAEATRNLTVSLNPGPGLKVFATPTSTDAITTVDLVAGQAVVYIQATVKNVSDGMLSAVSIDPSLTNANRSGINFVECYTRVIGGAYYADNGRGAVDRAVIWYEEALDSSEIPDSIQLCWPTEGQGCKKMYKIGGGITLDPNNAAHLVVPISPAFAEGQTKINGGSGLAQVFWVNPATPDAPSITQNVAMQDSVGPLLATAMLRERLAAGDDTLTVTFTEPVDYQKLPGQTLTLIKNGQPLQLTIKSATPGDNQQVIVAVDGTLSAGAPAAGDSLMITATGTVSDNAGNKAHPQNRPVVIGLQAVAPSLTAAAYFDLNGDGVVDLVRATFNKPVDLTAALIEVNFDGITGSQAVDPADVAFVENSGNAAIDFPLTKLYVPTQIQDKTSGAMQISAKFMNFPDGENESVVAAVDNAAPVVVRVAYHFGMFRDTATVPDADTLFIRYSEPLANQPSVATPLKFISTAGLPYQVSVTGAGMGTTSELTGFYRFIVDPAGPEQIPQGGTYNKTTKRVDNAKDSAWINVAEAAANAVDALTNAQTVDGNKKVAVEIKKPIFALQVATGPNPFVPGLDNSKSFRIEAKAKTREAEHADFQYSLMIFDKVGNLIHRIPESGTQRSTDKIEIYWNGVTKAGRLAGNGTYIGKLAVTYQYADGGSDVSASHFQTIKIAVRNLK
jgi:hypothetical protein